MARAGKFYLASMLGVATLFTAGFANGVQAQTGQQMVVFGGYGDSIQAMPFNPATGMVDTNAVVRTPAASPSWLVLNPNREQMFAVSEVGSPSPNPIGKVNAFRYKGATQPATMLNSQDTRGNQPTHASESPDGKYVFVANYAVDPNPGGSLAVLPIQPDGRLSPVSQLIKHKPSNVNPKWQASSHIHQVLTTPDKRYVIANDLGGDRTYVYRYDPASDPGRPLAAAPNPIVQLPPGSGPRHMAFSGDGQHAYLTLQLAGSVMVFDYADGKFTQRANISLLPPGSTLGKAAGAIGFSPDNQFLYVTNRANDNSVSVFAVDPATGMPTLIQRRSSEGREPRAFQFSPDGRYFLVANQFTNQVVTFNRDPVTGMIGDVVQTINLKGPSFVAFSPPH